MPRKTLLISTFNCDRRPAQGVCFEFVNIISRLERATIIAPEAVKGAPGALVHAMRANGGSVRSAIRQMRRAQQGLMSQPARVDQDHDLCFFMCQYLRELPNVERVKGWRERSRRAVAFILESWSSTLEDLRSEIRILDKFDHVFVLNADVVPRLQRYTRTPVSFLPPGADCLAGLHGHEEPARVIDVLCIGRRIDAVHQRMLHEARERGWYYAFDSWAGLRASDWATVRAVNAGMIRRSRYFVAWDPSYADKKSGLMRGDRAFTTRHFEGAGGGAILLGSRTRSSEFDACFDWPDAVIEISPDGSDLAERLSELEADPARQAAIRRNNMLNFLRRHDWAHRWAHMVETLGLEITPAHRARQEALASAAQAIESRRGARRRSLAPVPGRPPILADMAAVAGAANGLELPPPEPRDPDRPPAH
jgi:hypothetical protein